MKEKFDLLYEMLYNKSEKDLLLYIKNCNEPVMLHFIAANYNWDNGFDIPLGITENKFCDIGTALMIFEYAEGYMMFLDDNWQEYFGENIEFISNLKTRLENKNFQFKTIKYLPELSRTDIYKLKKRNTTLDYIFIDGTAGQCLEIPIY